MIIADLCSYSIFGYCRHPDDEFDRYWFPIQGSNSTFIQSTSPLQRLVASKIVGPNNGLWGEPPARVVDTTLTSSGDITITFPDDYSYQYILSFYYAELNSTANASSRNFYLQVPGSDFIVLNPYSNASNAVFSAVVELYPSPLRPWNGYSCVSRWNCFQSSRSYLECSGDLANEHKPDGHNDKQSGR